MEVYNRPHSIIIKYSDAGVLPQLLVLFLPGNLLNIFIESLEDGTILGAGSLAYLE